MGIDIGSEKLQSLQADLEDARDSLAPLQMMLGFTIGLLASVPIWAIAAAVLGTIGLGAFAGACGVLAGASFVLFIAGACYLMSGPIYRDAEPGSRLISARRRVRRLERKLNELIVKEAGL